MITFGYGVEITSGEKPATFKQLTRINSLPGLTITPETIDASALEDYVTKSVAGRADNGGQYSVSVNFTPETKAEWAALIAAYKTAHDSGLELWFETIIPGFDDAFFMIAQPPQSIPEPAMDQNGLLVAEFPLTVVDYKEMDTKVAFS